MDLKDPAKPQHSEHHPLKRSRMDAILLNPEILSHIASAVYWHKEYFDNRLHLGDVLSLALTCHAFREPALDQLWRRQLTIFNLIKTLPEDAWFVYDGHYVGPDGSRQLFIVSTCSRFRSYCVLLPLLLIRATGYHSCPPAQGLEAF